MGTPIRVLIVEDSEDDVLLLLRELRRSGYEPSYERVYTAEAMEAALEEGEWDLVVSDHSMPAFDSLAALRMLRGKGFVDLPFIIVSGKIGEDLAVEAMKAGAQDYIMKDSLARLGPAVERELREAEVRRERRRAEEKYRSIFENAVEGIYQTTVGGKLLTANPAMTRIFGYDSPEEMTGAVSDIRELYVDPERRNELVRLIQRHGAAFGFEVQGYRKDGSVIWVSLNARALHDDTGRLVGFEGTLEDITRRKRAEEALREMREAERRRIARDLHDEVLQDLTYALQSMKAVRMVRAARPAPEGDATGEADELEGQAQALQRAVTGLRTAIYDLRAGDVRGRSFVASLEELVEHSRRMSPECDIRFSVADGVLEALPEEAAPEMLRIIQEALANARRHSGAGSVRIALDLEGEEVRAEVADDGRGFEPEVVPGMGLTGMRERAQALGGELEVWSEPGRGTRVIFRTPVRRSREQAG